MTQLDRHYAEALYSLFQDEAALTAAAGHLLACPPLMEALCNPCVARVEKDAVLVRVLPDVPAPLAGFFRLLCRNGRMDLLPDILAAYHAAALSAQGAAEAVMRTAFPPTAAQLSSIADALAARHGLHRVDLTVREDQSLLGGFVLTLGSDTYDHSVLGALRHMRSALV